MNRILYLLLICLGFVSCEQDRWGNYYDTQDAVVSDQTVWDAASDDNEINQFIDLMKQVELTDRLQGKEVLTLFAPKNGTFDGSSMSDEEKTAFVKNHMVSSNIVLANLQEEERYRTLNSKYIRVAEQDDAYTVNEEIGIDPAQKLCKNGSLIIVDAPILPEANLYDYVLSLGDDYSLIRDTLMANELKIFDKENSLPVDMDALGNTIYDTVWVYTNDIFSFSGDFSDESETYSVMIPTNEQFLAAREQVFDYMQSKMGHYPQAEDTLMVQDWLFSAMVYEGIIDEANVPEKMESLGGQVWISDKQGDITGTTSVSNGVAATISGFKVPLYKYMGVLNYWPGIWYNSMMTDQMHEDYFVFGEGVADPPVGGAIVDAGHGGVAWVQINEETVNKTTLDDPSTRNLWMECLPVQEIESNGEKSLVVRNLVPGTYEVTFSLRDWKHPNVQVYVNGQPIGKPVGKQGSGFNWGKDPNDLTWDKVIGYYTHEDGDPDQVFVRFETAGDSPSFRLVPFRVLLRPTESVY
ncbi:fasciclin domain-containing protein [Puteibacter caeruleilacunae]|nr:fasciclin domain-containing protein [Puteibacter caeruleilacunae]